MTTELYRALIVLLPAGILTWQFAHGRHGTQCWTGGLLAYTWQFQWRLACHAAAVTAGGWVFTVDGMSLYGVPIDIVLGHSLLFGPLAVLCTARINPFLIAAADLAVTLLVLPIAFADPVCALALAPISLISVVPSLYLARWTQHDRRIYLRTGLQSLSWMLLLLWLFPSLLFQVTADNWQIFISRPWSRNIFYLAPLLLPAGMLGSAIYEFARHGRGTAFPYDPPKYLVTSGIYRHISNPMQVGVCLLMGGWAWALQSLAVGASAAVAVMLFIVFKDVCNGSCEIGLSDPNWRIYQERVPKWIPRLRSGYT